MTNRKQLTPAARTLLASIASKGGKWINGEDMYHDKALDAAVSALIAFSLIEDSGADDGAQDAEDYATLYVPTPRGLKSYARAQAAGLA